jgi:hypothetical protein
MSQLESIEDAVVSLISSIQSGGQDVFAVVRGTSRFERSAVIAELRRERTPAALVGFDGRRGASGEPPVPEPPRLAVYAADVGWRDGGEARVGGTGVAGGFDLLDRLTTALQDAVVVTNYRLVFIDESPFASDDRIVIHRQRYEARRQSELGAPTFDGQTLCGGSSVVNVIVGSPRRSVVAFGFPGIDRVFRHDLGGRGRPIAWRGQLRAASDAALNAIEQTIEAFVADPRSFDLTDAWGRTFTGCVLDAFERRGPRREDSVGGQSLQDFELRFEQIDV